MLEYLISSKTERDLLVLFFTNPSSRFYVRDMSRRIGQQPNAVVRELKKLELAGLVTKKQEGNLLYYGVNRSSSIFSELKSIILKSAILSASFTGQLKKFSKSIVFAFIYGSYAKGEERPGSDIDVMIIGEVDPKILNRAFTALEKKVGREINYTAMPYGEFINKSNSGFIFRVLNDKKIMLLGDENDLRKFITRG